MNLLVCRRSYISATFTGLTSVSSCPIVEILIHTRVAMFLGEVVSLTSRRWLRRMVPAHYTLRSSVLLTLGGQKWAGLQTKMSSASKFCKQRHHTLQWRTKVSAWPSGPASIPSFCTRFPKSDSTMATKISCDLLLCHSINPSRHSTYSLLPQ